MPASEGDRPPTRPADVRLRGFAGRAALDAVIAWVDARTARLPAVEVEVAASIGRVPAAPVAARADLPPHGRAAEDGYAVRAADTVGASAYGPATLRLQDAAAPLAVGAAALVAAGAPLPPGADAVVAFPEAEASGATVEVTAAVPEGAGVERAGEGARAGAELLSRGRPIRAHDAALLAAAGVLRVPVVRRPRVQLVVAGPKGGGADAHGPMLRALLERDGALVDDGPGGTPLREVLLRGATDPAADLVVATGRSGTGPDDDGPLALAEAGELSIHGVALRPGGSAALGLVGGRPVVLLPGDPLAALCAYELVAGPAVRRLGGRDPGLPHATRDAEVARKLVSSVGIVEVCQVRLAGGRVEPFGVVEWGGLSAAARADGFVVVPAPLEGYGPGARVTVHLY